MSFGTTWWCIFSFLLLWGFTSILSLHHVPHGQTGRLEPAMTLMVSAGAFGFVASLLEYYLYLCTSSFSKPYLRTVYVESLEQVSAQRKAKRN